MSHINTNENGGILSPDHTNKTYAENGKPYSKWGRHYDRDIQRKIVDDIYAGHLTLEQMSEMLCIGKSYIRDWQRSFRPDVYGPPRRTRCAYNRNIEPTKPAPIKDKGIRYSFEERRNIVQAIKNGLSVSDASGKYRIYESVLRDWCSSRKYNKHVRHLPIPAPVQSTVLLAPVDKLMRNVNGTRIVLDLLLSGDAHAALIVAKALTSTQSKL